MLLLVQRPELLVRPNARSSHRQPTPTMGGTIIALVVIAYLSSKTLMDPVLGDIQVPLLFACAALFGMSFVGLLDDLFSLKRRLRLCVQSLAGAFTLLALDGLGLPVFAGIGLADEGWLNAVEGLVTGLVLLLGLVWFVNIYNFMDGIDGIAGVQCLGFCLGCQLLSGGVPGWAGDLLWVTAAVTLAFLCFNWAPARIFMGDVGSGFIGLLIGLQVLYLWFSGLVPLFVSLILLGAFWVDATYTLLVRIRTGQAFTEAHRSHAYQRLADRFGHAKTNFAFVLLLVFWMLPLSWLAMRFPAMAVMSLIVSIIPIGVLCVRYRAGLME